MPQCLIDSPSAKWWFDWEAAGGKPEDLVVHVERHADFDGLAVGWGIGNKKASAEECGEACRAHRRNPKGGGLGSRVRAWGAGAGSRQKSFLSCETVALCVHRRDPKGGGYWPRKLAA